MPRCQHLRAFGRLKPGITPAAAASEMSAIRQQLRGEYPTEYSPGSIAVRPLRDAIAGNVRPALYVLFAAVASVLLIASANVANLLLARGLNRQREMAVRAALGAGRGRLVRQLLTESLLLSAGGAALGVVLAFCAIRGLAFLAPASVPRIDRIAIDGRVLLFTVIIALGTGLLFGLVPALRGSAAHLRRTLASDSRSSIGGSGRPRAALVVVDLALALALVTGAGLMLRTVGSLMHVHPGFSPDRLVTLQFSLVGRSYAEDPAVVSFMDRTLARVRAVPGVEAVAIAAA